MDSNVEKKQSMEIEFEQEAEEEEYKNPMQGEVIKITHKHAMRMSESSGGNADGGGVEPRLSIDGAINYKEQ